MRIVINIAGRNYPLNVPPTEEETLRKVGKAIEAMVKDFEANFDIRDKQDALAMCALRLGTDAEIARLDRDDIVQTSESRLLEISRLLDDTGK